MAEAKKEYILKNFVIRELDKAEGVSERTNKPWIRFKFKTTDPQAGDRVFTYFPYGLTKPKTWPYEGAKVSSMTFTITEEGPYKGDCNVKKISYEQTSERPTAEENPFDKTSPKPETIPQNDEMITVSQGTCISYVKDLMVARLAWQDHKNLPKLSEMAEEVARVGIQFYRDVINNLKRMGEK